MDLHELIDEVAAREFEDYLDGGAQEARLIRWINQAYLEICEIEPWSFLQTTTSGTAPLTLTLGHVLSVVDETHENPLSYSDRRQLVLYDPDLSEVGQATFWYLESGEIKVWPADATSTFSVSYIQVPPELAEPGDKPLVPVRFHGLIIRGAMMRAFEAKVAFAAAAEVRTEWEREVKHMIQALRQPNYDAFETMRRTGSPVDYL